MPLMHNVHKYPEKKNAVPGKRPEVGVVCVSGSPRCISREFHITGPVTEGPVSIGT